MAITKIAVTGTKGKTTVVNVLAKVLRALGTEKVLHVNTEGHYLNGEQRSTMRDSIQTWNMRPTLCPGRYLYEFIHEDHTDKQYAAVLEASLGSSTSIGTGYAVVQVAAFLNVFDDHIGSSSRMNITSRQDLADIKSFIYTRMSRSAFAVCNADDPLVVGSLKALPEDKNIQVLYFGLNADIQELQKDERYFGYVTVLKGEAVLITKTNTIEIIPVKEVSWTLNGAYTPSIYNLLAVIASMVGYAKGEVPDKLSEVLADTHLDSSQGRLVRFTDSNGVTVIADYAHESESLQEIASVAKTLTGPGGKVIGVVRLAYNRPDEHVQTVGKAIATAFDSMVVYDKIDGHFFTPEPGEQEHMKFPKIVGRTSEVFHAAIVDAGGEATRVVREDEAITYAAKQAKSGDVVISIVGDDIARSIELLETTFKESALG